MNVQVEPAKLKAKDFASDQEVRWCPGCGDYAILKAVQVALANMGAQPDNTVFVSGIGCAARFPYYMATYGFHTIHGRAPAVASGVKIANPDLDVWVVSGDGDSLSIGGNHLLHILRRNVDVQSGLGQKSPSTPQGSIDAPVDACTFALGCNARFVARGIDIQAKELGHVFTRARDHKGASFVEIIQNCIVFNDDAFAHFTEKSISKNSQIIVKHGEKLIYGAASDKGIRVKPGAFELEAVTIGENGITEDDILVHDETNRVLAGLLVAMKPPEMPVALGVIYCDPATPYEQAVKAQVEASVAANGVGDLDVLLRKGSTWTVS
jgi:2-oxoglutarate ferredoxin oxidoreductase subunit beta